jgi:hypothetical protein
MELKICVYNALRRTDVDGLELQRTRAFTKKR